MEARDGGEDDLRATSDAIVEDLQRMQALETEKRELAPDDPKVIELSAHIERIAGRLHTNSVAQLEISEELADDPTAASDRPIGA